MTGGLVINDASSPFPPLVAVIDSEEERLPGKRGTNHSGHAVVAHTLVCPVRKQDRSYPLRAVLMDRHDPNTIQPTKANGRRIDGLDDNRRAIVDRLPTITCLSKGIIGGEQGYCGNSDGGEKPSSRALHKHLLDHRVQTSNQRCRTSDGTAIRKVPSHEGSGSSYS